MTLCSQYSRCCVEWLDTIAVSSERFRSHGSSQGTRGEAAFQLSRGKGVCPQSLFPVQISCWGVTAQKWSSLTQVSLWSSLRGLKEAWIIEISAQSSVKSYCEDWVVLLKTVWSRELLATCMHTISAIIVNLRRRDSDREGKKVLGNRTLRGTKSKWGTQGTAFKKPLALSPWPGTRFSPWYLGAC